MLDTCVRSVSPQALPGLLRKASAGDRRALDDSVSILYEELHKIARAYRSRWRGNDTLNTTALVHETYLKLHRCEGAGYENETHMLAVAARAMRQLLSNYARDRRALKRTAEALAIPLHDLREADQPFVDERSLQEMIDLNVVLERLEEENPRACSALECRFMLGLTLEETADVLDVSLPTVKRDLKRASDWLARQPEVA